MPNPQSGGFQDSPAIQIHGEKSRQKLVRRGSLKHGIPQNSLIMVLNKKVTSQNNQIHSFYSMAGWNRTEGKGYWWGQVAIIPDGIQA